jgi:hypothetical protein
MERKNGTGQKIYMKRIRIDVSFGLLGSGKLVLLQSDADKINQFYPVPNPQFPVNIINMIPHRINGDKQFIFDLFIAFAFQEQVNDFSLPTGYIVG